MRQIKSANIKVDVFPMAATKKETAPISKKDFMEELESFLAKDSKAKSNEPRKVVTKDEETLEVKESEEEFDAELTINLMDLNYLGNQQLELKKDAKLAAEVDFEINPDNLVKNKDSELKLDDLLSENLASASDSTSKLTNQTHVEDFLLNLETQLSENPELEVKDVIEELLSENKLELDSVIKNIDIKDIENISQVDLESVLGRRSLEIAEIKEMQDKGIKEEISIEQIEVIFDSRDKGLGLQHEVELESRVDFVSNIDTLINEKTDSTSKGNKVTVARSEKLPDDLNQPELSSMEVFESVNQVSFPNEVDAPIKSVAQEDFISNIETLMIEETESTSGGDKVTTARIQLTPERLGKVDLQIEINGKELTAKLIVEQKETKEWIDQQVAHLKEKLLTQEITVKDFQVVVHEENLNDTLMNSEENPFFKQKEKDSQARKEQRFSRTKVVEVPVQREERSYSTRNSISILV